MRERRAQPTTVGQCEGEIVGGHTHMHTHVHTHTAPTSVVDSASAGSCHVVLRQCDERTDGALALDAAPSADRNACGVHGHCNPEADLAPTCAPNGVTSTQGKRNLEDSRCRGGSEGEKEVCVYVRLVVVVVVVVVCVCVCVCVRMSVC